MLLRLPDVNFRLRIRAAAADGVAVRPGKLLFGKPQKPRDREGQDEVQHADNGIDLEGLQIDALDDACHVVKLRHADDVQDRGVLDVDDKLVADRRQNVLQNLRNDDLDHRLRVRHADGVGAFQLPLVDGNDAAADNLCHVGAGVNGDDEKTGRNQRQRRAVIQESVAPVDDHRLDHHRRAAEDFDVDGNDGVDDFVQHAHNGVFGARRGADDARKQTDQKAGGCTDQGNEHRIADAGKQVAVILADDSEYFSDKFHLLFKSFFIRHCLTITAVQSILSYIFLVKY